MFNQKEYQKNWYANPENRDKHRKAVRKSEKQRALKIRQWVSEYKVYAGSKVCGFREHACALDFDHRDGEIKLFNISSEVAKGSWKRIKEEMTKCDVLCANHHRLRHFGDRVSW